MTYKHSRGAVIAVALTTALAVTAADAPAPAPTSGSPAVYVDHAALTAELAKARADAKDPAVSPVSITDQYMINEVYRSKVSPPAIHPGWTELHFVLDGSGTFVTGGQITPAKGAAPSVIEGGVSRKVSKGDAVIVPPGTAHWYRQIDGGITVIEVRFIAPSATGAKQ